MDESFFLGNPDVAKYFRSLPLNVQTALLKNDVAISSLGELQLWAEHYIHNPALH